MKQPKSKGELLARIQTERRQLERYLFYFERDRSGTFVPGSNLKFSREEMAQSGAAGEWSVKDVLAHVAECERVFLGWRRAGKRGKAPPDLADPDAWLRLFPPKNRRRSLDGALDDFRTSHQQLLKAVRAIPSKSLFTPGQYEWTADKTLADYVVASTCERYRWAKYCIRRWMKTHKTARLSKAILLEKIQTERRQLEKALAKLSKKEMVVPGVVGEWSVKDVLAHLFDWERRFVGWYEAGRRGEIPRTPAPGMAWKDLGRLNQQVFEKHRQRILDDVLAEFDASYRRTLALVQAMSEEELFQVGRCAWTGKANLVGYIAANTCNHYRWAKTQIRKWTRTLKR